MNSFRPPYKEEWRPLRASIECPTNGNVGAHILELWMEAPELHQSGRMQFPPQRSITQIPITDGLRIEITIQRRRIVFTTHEMDGKPYWASSYPQSNRNEVISGGMGPSPRQCYKATYEAIQGKPLKRGFSVEAQFGFTEEVKSKLRSLWGDEINSTAGNCT